MGVIGLLFTMYRHLCCSYLWFSRINACLCFTLADFWMVCLKSCCAKLSKIIIHYSLLVHIRHFKEKLFIVCTSGNIIFCLPACRPVFPWVCLSLCLILSVCHAVSVFYQTLSICLSLSLKIIPPKPIVETGALISSYQFVPLIELWSDLFLPDVNYCHGLNSLCSYFGSSFINLFLNCTILCFIFAAIFHTLLFFSYLSIGVKYIQGVLFQFEHFVFFLILQDMSYLRG